MTLRCPQCEFYLQSMLGLCDAKCLAGNETVDSQQFKSLLSSNVNNIKALNIFLQRKAAQMIEYLYEHEDPNMKKIGVAVYFGKLGQRHRSYIMSLPDNDPAKQLLIKMDSGDRPDIKQLIVDCVT